MHPVRTATPVDADMLGEMLADFNREFDAEGQDGGEFARRLTGLLSRTDVLALLVGPADAPEGFAFVTFRPTPYADGPLAQLEELYVRPSLRAEGRGAALLDALHQVATARETFEILINVDGDDVDARRFYEAHGFTCVDPDSSSTMLCYLRTL